MPLLRMPTNRVEVAAEVRAVLARKRSSQRQLAKALGLTQPVIWRRLQGDMQFRVDELQAVAEFVEVPVSTLFPGDAATPAIVSAGDAA